MVKVSIIGVGRVGATLAYSLISNKKIDEIVLIDIIKPKVEGTILDISHAFPEYSNKLKMGTYDDTEGSKIIIITAGVPRTPDIKTRMDLLNTNKKITEEIVKSIKFSKDTIFVILTNPVEPLTYLVYKLTKLPWNQVIGFSNILDTARFNFILSQKTGVPSDKINSIVIGQHDENMIPIFSNVKINGKNLDEYRLNISEIADELKFASKKILETVGGTQFGPVRHLESLINSILNDSNTVFPVSCFIEKSEHYDLEKVCLSLPARVGIMGVNKVENIKLSDDEKSKLKTISDELKKIQSEIKVE